MVKDIERLQHELHSRTNGFKRKVERAQQIMQDGLAVMKNGYVAFSSGIDSLCVLDMLYSSDHQLAIFFGNDGFDFPDSLAFLKETEKRYSFRLRHIRCMQPWRDWCNEMGRPDLAEDPQALAVWGNPHEWEDTWQSLKDARSHGYDGVFLGLLACESQKRRLALHNGYKPLYQVKRENGMWHCSPLAHFSKADVWAYVCSRHVPYNPVYNKLAELGVPLERRRVAPLVCFSVLQYGSGVILRSGWPDLYNRLAATFPRVREYS